MSSTTPSPVSHRPAPLNINYDSDDDDVQMDSDNDHHHIHREPDADADGESIDEDVSPTPMAVHVDGFSSSHHHEVSVGCMQYFVACLPCSLIATENRIQMNLCVLFLFSLTHPNTRALRVMTIRVTRKKTMMKTTAHTPMRSMARRKS